MEDNYPRLSFRVGRGNPKYFKGEDKNPYYIQEWVPIETLRYHLEKIYYTFRNDSKPASAYNQTDFPYYLFLLEFRIVGREDLFSFKYDQVLDFDYHPPSELPEDEKKDLMNKFIKDVADITPSTQKKVCVWFTGSKGCRVVNVDGRAHVQYMDYAYSIARLHEDPFRAEYLKSET